MPKRAFFPAALIVFGLIEIAAMMGLLPTVFNGFWPIIMIVCGLGGLLISDSEEWMKPTKPQKMTSRTSAAKSRSR